MNQWFCIEVFTAPYSFVKGKPVKFRYTVNCGCCVVLTVFRITSICTAEKIIREPPHYEHML